MVSDTKRKVLEYFTAGRNMYKLMEFGEARQLFAQALELDPDDGPSRVYLDRCQHYLDNPPPEDWDGVFVMQTK
ncbi:tetratricopeptide repeat protein [Spirochaeta africana]|uniref:Tetratricopeptide repeat protein n=1 Tax=Spirochaeta africana (strain ATCC 700263 / DSM 8902 / Z-7692) TaxID=889378 RepID=H9UKE8_SPIAZ|nr:tetratricopeptide repeat protein [Spirochaeta africana]AFG37991.1 tetratricopeptide repeat protein [Spirochaeta africana DSM 8902]